MLVRLRRKLICLNAAVDRSLVLRQTPCIYMGTLAAASAIYTADEKTIPPPLLAVDGYF
jgi:hypothetical protein